MSQTPFAYLDASRKNRGKIALTLLTAIVNNQLVAVIAKTKPTIIDKFRKSSIIVAKRKSFIIYCVKDLDSVPAGVACLLKMRMWHKPTFRILIARDNIIEKIKSLLEKQIDNIDSIERMVESDILGYIDPVDDELQFYGDNLIEAIIYEIFPFIKEQ